MIYHLVIFLNLTFLFSLQAKENVKTWTLNGTKVDHQINKREIDKAIRTIHRFVFKDGYEVVTLKLNLNGGDLEQAILLTEEIKRLNRETQTTINTQVSGSIGCHSACTIIFTAGKKRIAKRNATFGFHSPSTDQSDEKPLIPVFRDLWLDYIYQVDSVLGEKLEAEKSLFKSQFTYFGAHELSSGYVTDFLD